MRVPEMEDEFVKGTCQKMCPKSEAELRQRENLLHKFEMKKGTECNRLPEYDPEKAVKCFNRSAAGKKTTDPTNLRPFKVLMRTIHYLYREVFPLHLEEPLCVYNFMFDRFRAIRQDAVIQNLDSGKTIQILEPIVRFMIYFGYILAPEDVKNFDGHINTIHLQECIKSLLVCYDECHDESELVNRWEIESVYLLLYLGNTEALSRGVQFCHIATGTTYEKCLKLSIQWYLNNYQKVLSCIPELSPILLCAVSGHIPTIRKYSLQAMSVAFSSKNSAYPLSHLRHLLLYECDKEAEEDCRFYNVNVNGKKINFLKTDFDGSMKSKCGITLSWINHLLTNSDLIKLLCN